MIKLEKGLFTTVPTNCIRGQSPYIQTLYMRLCKYTNDSGKCRPSIKTLCNDTGMSKNTLLKSINELENIGLINKNNRCHGTEYTSNMYDVYTDLSIGGSAGDEPPSAGDELGGSAGDEPPSAGDGNELKQLTKSSSLTINISDLDFFNGYEQDKTKFINYWNMIVKTKEGDVCRWQQQKTFDIGKRWRTWISKLSGVKEKDVASPPHLTNDELLFKEKSGIKSDGDVKEIYKYCLENGKTAKVKIGEKCVGEEYGVPVYSPIYAIIPNIEFVTGRIQSIEKRVKDKGTTLNNLSSLFIKWQQ